MLLCHASRGRLVRAKQTNPPLCVAYPICVVTSSNRVADEHYGRFHTILAFLGVYVVGLIILTVSAVEELTTKTGVYLALAILAVGAGGIKANVSRTHPAPTAKRTVQPSLPATHVLARSVRRRSTQRA